MWLRDSVYNTVPGVYITFGLSTLFFGSEAYLFGRGLLYSSLLFVSGTILVISGLLVLRLRRRNIIRARLMSGNPDLTP